MHSRMLIGFSTPVLYLDNHVEANAHLFFFQKKIFPQNFFSKKIDSLKTNVYLSEHVEADTHLLHLNLFLP